MQSNVSSVYGVSTATRLSRPHHRVRAQAGTPVPAGDCPPDRIDLNRRLIKNPLATVFVGVDGDSMIGELIYENDILIVDSAVKVKDGDVIAASLNGAVIVKRLRIEAEKVWLESANDQYDAIQLGEQDRLDIWGRVMYSITPH